MTCPACLPPTLSAFLAYHKLLSPIIIYYHDIFLFVFIYVYLNRNIPWLFIGCQDIQSFFNTFPKTKLVSVNTDSLGVVTPLSTLHRRYGKRPLRTSISNVSKE